MKKQKGITLIALIITIIVMLILVGVTINVALNGGLIEKTQDAARDTQTAAEKEQLLAAVLATIGTNGEVDFDKVVLPDGFDRVIGKDGVYKSTKSGTTYTVDPETLFIEGSTGGSEDADNPILGTYYATTWGIGSDILYIELKGNNEITASDGGEELQGTYTYDKNSKAGKITIQYENTDSSTGQVTIETMELPFSYTEITDENSNVINSILEIIVNISEKNETLFYAKKGITGLAPLTGYIYENGTDTIEFNTEVEDGITRGTYAIKRNGAVLNSQEGYYVCYNGKIFWFEEDDVTISEDLSTITINGTVYTKR